MEKIIAVNSARVGDFLGIKLAEEIDLLKSQDEKIKKFVFDYGEYLSSNKIEKIKEFYKLTGLMLTHIIENDERENRTIYSMNNIFKEGITTGSIKKPIYTTHILVISKYDDNSYEYFKRIYEKNQNELKIGNNIRYTLSCVCRNVKSKISEIEKKFDENAFKEIDKSTVKEIFLTPLNNLCILLKDGKLYLDGKIYAENVDTIWHQDSYNAYIIYKNNKVEELTCQFAYSKVAKYKKVVYNNYMMALLDKKVVTLTILVDKPDTCIMTSILNIDDVECTKNMLYLTIKNQKIKIPSMYNTIVVDN